MTTEPPCSFERLALIPPLLRALSDEGYGAPTPVQQAAIPEGLAGRDLLVTAKTGTGKTAAFALPILQRLHQDRGAAGRLRALVLTPTRELAHQVGDSLRVYGRHLPLRTAVVVGGLSAGPQVTSLRRHPDILVATPGRLLDLLGQGHIPLRDVQIAVLDEADRMLDMGFIRDVRRIVGALPHRRQTLLFSATLTDEIAVLAADMLQRPARVQVTPPTSVADNIAQKVLFVEQTDKLSLLTRLFDDPDIRRALVFTRTKHRANRVSRQLSQAGVSADAIHSNKSQGARQRALELFHRGRVRVLVATDIVARGIDVEDISHVINYEMPADPESYVHRVGRTARAGRVGVALSFCNADEIPLLAGIENLIRTRLVEADHPFHSRAIAALRTPRPAARPHQPSAARPQHRPPRRPARPPGSAAAHPAAAPAPRPSEQTPEPPGWGRRPRPPDRARRRR